MRNNIENAKEVVLKAVKSGGHALDYTSVEL